MLPISKRKEFRMNNLNQEAMFFTESDSKTSDSDSDEDSGVHSKTRMTTRSMAETSKRGMTRRSRRGNGERILEPETSRRGMITRSQRRNGERTLLEPETSRRGITRSQCRNGERILEPETSRRGMITRSQRRNGGSTKKKRTRVIRSAVKVSVRNLKVTVTIKHCSYRRTIWCRVLKLLNKFDIGVTRINIKTKKNKYSEGKIRGNVLGPAMPESEEDVAEAIRELCK